MTLYFSLANKGFYDDAIHTTLPDDAQELSKEEHQALLEGQSAGKKICFESADRPVLTDHPKATREENLARVRTEREALFDALDKAEMIATRRKDKARIAAVQTEKERLCDLPAKLADLSDDELAEFHATLEIEV